MRPTFPLQFSLSNFRLGLALSLFAGMLAACPPHATSQIHGVPSGTGADSGGAPSELSGMVPELGSNRAPVPPSPVEYRAFVSAMGTTPAGAQAAALQQFLENYPNSSLVPAARRGMATARLRDAPAPAAAAPAPSPVSVVAPAADTAPATVSAPRQEAIQPPAGPAQQAVIDLKPHSLTIRAYESSLSQILRELCASSGMKVEGLAQDQRIYGSLGPGEPDDVLSSLVGGLDYNVLMVGGTNRGLPRQLILSPRTQEAAAQGPSQQGGNTSTDDENAQEDQAAPPEVQPMPGRIFTPAAPGPDPAQNGRTAQQMLEDLRRMHPQGETTPTEQPQ